MDLLHQWYHKPQNVLFHQFYSICRGCWLQLVCGMAWLSCICFYIRFLPGRYVYWPQFTMRFHLRAGRYSDIHWRWFPSGMTLHILVKLNSFQWCVLGCIRFWSIIWLQIGLSICRAPFLMQSFMLTKLGGFSVTPEEWWSCLIKVLLVIHEAMGLPSVMWFLECVLFQEASSWNLICSSTKLTIALFLEWTHRILD